MERNDTVTYDPAAIEAKWQRVWEDEQAFVVPNPEPGAVRDASKTYVVEMLPYPSGELHMGHTLNYTIGDVLVHLRRRSGLEVLRPMGYDAFGLPAENAAINEGRHPREVTDRNIATIREQMGRMGWAMDWSRELSTADPTYYRWTQWLFLRFFEKGLAYRKEAPVKWCPKDQTVLANEQVIDGHCERCGTEVEAKSLTQWFFKITDYADALLDEMELLEQWPERVLTMQRNWIGRSHGARVLFRVDGTGEELPVFTTRPDTLFGATFFVLAPEHPLVGAAHGRDGARARRGGLRAARDRAHGGRARGQGEGRRLHGPLRGQPGQRRGDPDLGRRLRADGVRHRRDHGRAGARRARPCVRREVRAGDQAGRRARGRRSSRRPARSSPTRSTRCSSTPASSRGLPAPEGKRAITAWLAEHGLGEETIGYRLRDWLLSRQRYWGCPIPIVHCETCGAVPVPDEQLPVVLPEVEDFMPKGRSPLAAAEEWVATTCPSCGGPARRETDTMDTFVDSSWYFIRYCDPQNDHGAVLARARRLLDADRPVHRRHRARGAAPALLPLLREGDERARADRLPRAGGAAVQPGDAAPPRARRCPSRRATSSSRCCTRTATAPTRCARTRCSWARPTRTCCGRTRASRGSGDSSTGCGAWRTTRRRALRSTAPVDTPLARKAHRTIAKVTDDIDRRFLFHTPISAVMELVNEIQAAPDDPAARFAAETAVSLIQPYAPHIAEELWVAFGHERLWRHPWPKPDPALLVEDTVEVVVQVNGKLRDRLHVPADTPEDELVRLALASERVRAHLNGGEPAKTIVVPGKLVNLVI